MKLRKLLLVIMAGIFLYGCGATEAVTTEDIPAFYLRWDLEGYCQARSSGFGDDALNKMIASKKAIIIPSGTLLKIVSPISQPDSTETVEYRGQQFQILEHYGINKK
jgi:hypothetical protein